MLLHKIGAQRPRRHKRRRATFHGAAYFPCASSSARRSQSRRGTLCTHCRAAPRRRGRCGDTGTRAVAGKMPRLVAVAARHEEKQDICFFLNLFLALPLWGCQVSSFFSHSHQGRRYAETRGVRGLIATRENLKAPLGPVGLFTASYFVLKASKRGT